MKQIFFTLCALALPTLAWSATEDYDGGYSVTKDGVVFTIAPGVQEKARIDGVASDYTGTSLVIPFVAQDSLGNDVPVCDIAEGAFENSTLPLSFGTPGGDPYDPQLFCIGARAFKNATGLTDYNFSTNYKYNLGDEAFAGTGITAIPCLQLYEEVGEAVFKGCQQLTEVGVACVSSEGGKEIGSQMFAGCTVLKHALISWAQSIGDGAFIGCSALEDVNFGRSLEVSNEDGLQQIGPWAFGNCTSLKSINIASSSLLSVGDYAFAMFTGNPYDDNDGAVNVTADITSQLSTITMSGCVEFISSFAFANLSNLKEVIFTGSVLPECVFMDDDDATLNLTAGDATAFYRSIHQDTRLSAGQNALNMLAANPDQGYGWNAFTTDAKPTYTQGDVIYYLNAATHTASAQVAATLSSDNTAAAVTVLPRITTADGTHYEVTDFCSLPAGSTVRKLTIEAPITVIPDSCFQNATSLSEVQLPGTCTKIGDKAFNNCTALQYIQLPQAIVTIGEEAFKGSGLKSITLSEFVATGDRFHIGDGACEDCAQLETVNISSQEEIPQRMFKNCRKLKTVIWETKDVTNLMKFIGRESFMGCTSLTAVPIKAAMYGQDSFKGCTGITEITLPSPAGEVTQINVWDGAFADIPGLRQVNVNNPVSSFYIATGAFTNSKSTDTPPVLCVNVIDVDYYKAYFSDYSTLTPIDEWAGFTIKQFSDVFVDVTDNFVEYRLNKQTKTASAAINPYNLPQSYTVDDNTPTIVIPASFTHEGVTYPVTSLWTMTTRADNGFAYHAELQAQVSEIPTSFFPSGLASFTIPECVTTIGNRAFANAGLTSIVVPATVKAMGSAVFYSNTRLTSATINADINMLPANTFERCERLTNAGLTLGSGIYALGPQCFEGCDAITGIPAQITHIGADAFDSCGFTSLTIPATVKEIGEYAFRSCASMESVTIDLQLSVLPKGIFSQCDDLTQVTLPSSLTTIDTGAFEATMALTEITLPENLKTIGYAAFLHSNLKDIVIPNSVEYIDAMAFQLMPDMSAMMGGDDDDADYVRSRAVASNGDTSSATTGRTIHIGSGVKYIGQQAFYNMFGEDYSTLQHVTSDATVPPTLGLQAFGGHKVSTIEIMVPGESISQYQTTPQWRDFSYREVMTGVDNVMPDAVDQDAPADIYTIAGVAVGRNVVPSAVLQDMPAGIYILRQGASSQKIAVR